jgi:hypothetical protein
MYSVGPPCLGGSCGFSLVSSLLASHSITGSYECLQWSVELAPRVVDLTNMFVLCIGGDGSFVQTTIPLSHPSDNGFSFHSLVK